MIIFSNARAVIDEAIQKLKYDAVENYHKERDMLIDYYTFNHTERYISKYFSHNLREEIPLYPVNMTRRLINRISMVYKEAPIRNVESEDYFNLIRGGKKDFILKKIERVHNLIGTMAVRVSWEEDKGLCYYPLMNFEPIFDEYDPLNPMGIVYPIPKPTGSRYQVGEGDMYVYWTADEHFMFDDSGKIIEINESNINPYGCIPFVFLQPNSQIDEFWNEGEASDIGIANTEVDIAMTMLQHHIRSAGGQFVIEGMVDVQEVRLGLNKVVALENAKMNNVSNSVNINEIIEGIKFQLQQVAQNHHITFDFGLSGSKSGTALKIENLELMEAREDDAEKFSFFEHDLYYIERKIVEIETGTILPEDFSVDFAEMDFPDIEREREEWDWKFQHGLADKLDYLMEKDPDKFPDRESAEKYLAERKKSEMTIKKQADVPENIFQLRRNGG